MSTLYPDAADRNSQQERDVYKGDARMKMGDFSQEKGRKYLLNDMILIYIHTPNYSKRIQNA